MSYLTATSVYKQFKLLPKASNPYFVNLSPQNM